MPEYKNGYPTDWLGGGAETSCGGGSMAKNMVNVAKWLPPVIRDINPRSVIELGCGDLNFARHCIPPEYRYMGIDIKERESWKQYPEWPTYQGNIVTAQEFRADIVIARDVFIHLPNKQVLSILGRIQADYLISTVWLNADNSKRTQKPFHDFSPIDLSLKPFELPVEILIKENYPNKYLGIYKMR